MRALTTILFATATLLGGATATATAADGAPLHATAQQMGDMEGNYELSNGQRVRLFVMDNRLYIGDKQRYQELQLIGPDSWATRNRTLSLQFKPGLASNQIVIKSRDDVPVDIAPIRLAARDQRGRGSID